MKFLCIWRFYRLSALLDGIEIPENMNRCMSNNYTVTGFWRGWHRSFNQWLIRYIYIPLGGSRVGILKQVLNIFITFTFVIYAHAPSVLSDPQILAWGWAMALFMVPELIGSYIFSSKSLRNIKSQWYWRWMVASGGSLTIVVLIAANICGYGIVLSGHKSPITVVQELLLYLFNPIQHWDFCIVTFIVFFASTNIMLAVRSLDVTRYSQY